MTAEQLVEGVVEAAILRPGDTLIVRCSAGTQMAQLDELVKTLKAKLAELMPGVEVLVMGGAIEQMIVHRSDEGTPE